MATLAIIVYVGSSPAFAALMKPVLNGSFVECDRQAITVVPVLIVVIFVFRGLAGFFSTFLMTKTGWGIVKQIRRELFDTYVDMTACRSCCTGVLKMHRRNGRCLYITGHKHYRIYRFVSTEESILCWIYNNAN